MTVRGFYGGAVRYEREQQKREATLEGAGLVLCSINKHANASGLCHKKAQNVQLRQCAFCTSLRFC